jgi:hypothetical protein
MESERSVKEYEEDCKDCGEGILPHCKPSEKLRILTLWDGLSCRFWVQTLVAVSKHKPLPRAFLSFATDAHPKFDRKCVTAIFRPHFPSFNAAK